MHCPHCYFQNDEASTYCERCGTYLHLSPQGTQTYIQQDIAPPPPPPSIHYPLYPPQNRVSPRSNITVFRVLRSMLYFLATFIAAVGLFGSMEYLLGANSSGAAVGLVLGLCLLLAGMLIFRRVRHRVAQLRWWQYLLALVAATGLLLLALTSPALTAPGRLPGIVIGIVILIYGMAVAAISCW